MSVKIIDNVDHINISSNEMIINATLNRNFAKLFDNDSRLVSNASAIYNGMYRILPWIKGKSYSKNDLVFFVDIMVPTKDGSERLTPKGPSAEAKYKEEFEGLNINSPDYDEKVQALKDKYYTVTLYLLRSTKNGNTNIPTREFVDGIPLFDASGWQNVNPSGSIFTDYFDEFTVYNLRKFLSEAHGATKTYHKFGELSSYAELNNHVLKTDLTNIDPDRSHIFFPNTTTEIPESKTIVTGSMRKWDCGLVEYDIIFKLGDTDTGYGAYNADGSLKLAEEIDANYLDLANKITNTNPNTAYDNRKYYLNDTDSDIFKIPSNTTIEQNGITMHNVNHYINSFCGTIQFPIPFINTNYMIMTTNIPSSMIVEGGDIESNLNQLVYVNKSKQSITAILIIPNFNTETYKLLASNRFRCQVTGRWR